MGFTLVYLSLIVLIPLAALFFRTTTLSWEQFWTTVTAPRVLASYQLSFGASLVAALMNAVFGLSPCLGACTLFFSWQTVVDGALVDLPFALPTAVAGLV